jgi:hypothetical protein
VGIVTGYRLEIMTEVSGPGKLSSYSDWLRDGDYDRSMRAGIAQWV